jgi:CRISPR-associated protein Cas2
MNEHLYLVTYDISDDRRWRRVFGLMKAYGQWVQLSVFQCRMTDRRRAELIQFLDGIINHREDHALVMDLGPADQVVPRVTSLGKEFTPLTRAPVIV